ncbi:hypothetical protein Acy02nite_49000 [Actinoplanes cyaneus]|uniref:Secreted protein n=1 Tax=Actinoplanes cyaneus TaxID=52696 RepID=A0A919IJM3_9ACTN|nr:hypothetical protein [Actinoplanes cyaneus]GID67019.1 hypothetical protein Acy02nite_49000 [Actinoplanes cyaneus]
MKRRILVLAVASAAFGLPVTAATPSLAAPAGHGSVHAAEATRPVPADDPPGGDDEWRPADEPVQGPVDGPAGPWW